MKDRDFGKFLSQPGMKLALLAAACGVILYFAVGLYLDPARAQTKAAGPRTPATAPKALLNADKQKNPEDRAADQPDPAVQRAIQNELKAADDLKSRLEFTEKRLDDIQKFLAVLSTVGAIFGFAFAVFTYVNVTELKASAKDELVRIKSSADTQLDQLKADFPAIARMNENVKRVFVSVGSESSLMSDGWDEDRYVRLSEESRESIRMSEITFAALEVFDPLKSPDLRRYAVEIYMAFGRFYGSCYRSFHVNNEPSIERAKNYFRKALKSDDPPLIERASASLGTVCCWHGAFLEAEAAAALDKMKALELGTKKNEVLKEARSTLDHACAIRSYNPSALLGRAWVKRRANQMESAIHDLDDLVAASVDKLSEEEKRRYLRTAYFNRACYRVIWGDSRTDRLELFASALDDLWESRTAAIKEDKFALWLNNVHDELQANKDLWPLLSVRAGTEFGLLKDRSGAKPTAARKL